MIKLNKILLLGVSIPVFVIAALVILPTKPPEIHVETPLYRTNTFSTDDWLHRSSGYQEAVRLSDSHKAPMLIYVYTDWCKNCLQFTQNLLSRPSVTQALTGFVKVKLNPEDGPQEEALSEKLGVRGYPNLFVQSGSKGSAVIVKAPFIPTDSGWQLMKPEQFLDVLNNHGLTQRGGQ